MKVRSGVVVALVAGLSVLVLMAAPAIGKHDRGQGKSRDDHAQTQRESRSKADRSDDGEKPFDEEPNDHPSGKDRSEEPGGSGTQGKSESDPDGDANGGADKPGGTGGFDDDKDGNNGCGNDDDFEDDNNGWCGKPDEPDTDAVGTVKGKLLEKDRRRQGSDDSEVLGTRIQRPEVTVAAARSNTRPEVAGVLLPFTGPPNVALFLAAALSSLIAGWACLRIAWRRAHK